MLRVVDKGTQGYSTMRDGTWAKMNVQRNAYLSGDKRFRYWLTRRWGPGQTLVFIMLNPSTADAELDDMTIRRCMRFGKDLGFDGINVLNLFAYRATDPKDLADAYWPIGPENDACIEAAIKYATFTQRTFCAAWGALDGPCVPRDRANDVHAMFDRNDVQLHCLGMTKEGYPRHPLYLRADSALQPWVPIRS